MKKLLLLCAISVFGALSVPSQSIVSQSEANTWIYALTSTDNVFELLRLNTADGKAEQLFSLTSPSQDSLATILPKAEVERIKTIFPKLGLNDQVTMAQKPNLSLVRSMSVAPNGQEVALNVSHRYCFGQNMICLGTSQIILVSKDKHRVLWNLGFHDKIFASKHCSFSKDKFLVGEDLYIEDIQWTPDGSSIIAELRGGVLCFDVNDNSSLVAVPVSDGQAFIIGEARIWAISDDSRTVGATVRDCKNACKDSVGIIRFDPRTHVASSSSYSLNQYSIVYEPFGMAFVKGSLVFDVYDSSKLEGGGGLMVFNPAQSSRLSISPRMEGGDKRIHALSGNDSAIIETEIDGSLWQVTVEGNSLQTRQFVKGPVGLWRVGRGKTLLVQLKSDPTYSVIDEQSNVKRKIDVEAKIKATGQNIKSIVVDW